MVPTPLIFKEINTNIQRANVDKKNHLHQWSSNSQTQQQTPPNANKYEALSLWGRQSNRVSHVFELWEPIFDPMSLPPCFHLLPCLKKSGWGIWGQISKTRMVRLLCSPIIIIFSSMVVRGWASLKRLLVFDSADRSYQGAPLGAENILAIG